MSDEQLEAGLVTATESSTARTKARAPRPWFDAMAVVARQKLNAPPEWEWCYARVIGEATVGHRCDTLVKGGVPNRRKDGSKRTGHSRWRGVAVQECVVTRAEIEAARTDYERDTGNCVDCAGSGETMASCGVNGTTYRTCRRCGGSGRASVVLAVDPSVAVTKNASGSAV